MAASFAISIPASLAQQAATENQNLSYAELRRAHPGWVQVPGMLVRPDCVHEIPDGATINTEADDSVDVIVNETMIAHWGACPEQGIHTRSVNALPSMSQVPNTGNGWVEAFAWSGSEDLLSISARWFVPQNPQDIGATIYMFDGVETTDQDYVLQPVLQNFGDGNWSIESYYVHGKSTIVMHSSAQAVSSSDTILGTVNAISSGPSGTLWEVFIEDQTNGAESYFDYTTKDLHFTFSLAAVLEAHNLNACTQFPANGSSEFTNVTANPSHGWTAMGPSSWRWTGPSCNFGQTESGPNLILSY